MVVAATTTYYLLTIIMNYNALSMAIIWQAVKDYRFKKENGKSTVAEEKFFSSKWCDFLLLNTRVTGKDILRQLEEE